MSSLTFVTNPICPFAHRVWLTLEEIGLKYETKETPLTDKPAWFTEIYGKALGSDPTSDGKVPVLQDDDFILTESAVVAEYLAEKYGHSTGLLGKSAEDRARIRIFTEQFTGKFIPLWYGVIRAQDDESKAKATKDFLALTARISKEYERTTGPFFLGSEASLADVLLFPWIFRLPVLTHYRGYEVPNTPEYAAFHKFVAAFTERKSAKAAAPPQQLFIDGYYKYANPSK